MINFQELGTGKRAQPTQAWITFCLNSSLSWITFRFNVSTIATSSANLFSLLELDDICEMWTCWELHFG
jgi:hypothetical protein